MKGQLMSENNGENTTRSNEQSEQDQPTPSQHDGAATAPEATAPETSQPEGSASQQPQQPRFAQAPHTGATPASPSFAPRQEQQPWAAPVQAPQSQAPYTQAPQAPYAPAPQAQPVRPTQQSQAPQQPPAGAPSPGYAAPPAYGAPSHSATSHGATSQNPTEPIPQSFGHQGFGEGYAGPGYPASNAYPHSVAPAVAPQSRRKEGRKVGMGMFTSGVLAAALVGGLVGGGSLFLLDQQNNNTATGSSQQSAPLVVNNTNSVNQVTAAAAKAMPSVVTISATSGTSGGTGSGIILDTEGHILTNTHVVTLDGAAAHATIQVQTSNNKVYDATIVGTDPLSDLAIIKIDAPNLVPATLGDSNKINVGDTVIAIGSPLGLNATVTEGIVSTLNRTIQVASSAVPETPGDSSPNQGDGGNGFQFSPPGGGQSSTTPTGTVNLNVIQTDAAINPGNSGGALVNAQGQVIGVNVAIASTGSSSGSSSQSGNIGVGFSIPMDHAQRIAQDIIKTGKATHGQLGVTVGGTSSTGSSSSFSTGATVAKVTAGSAAAKAGLKEGDVITQMGNRTISDPADLTAAVREQAGGATVKVDFTRAGKAQSVDVTLDTMTAS